MDDKELRGWLDAIHHELKTVDRGLFVIWVTVIILAAASLLLKA